MNGTLAARRCSRTARQSRPQRRRLLRRVAHAQTGHESGPGRVVLFVFRTDGDGGAIFEQEDLILEKAADQRSFVFERKCKCSAAARDAIRGQPSADSPDERMHAESRRHLFDAELKRVTRFVVQPAFAIEMVVGGLPLQMPARRIVPIASETRRNTVYFFSRCNDRLIVLEREERIARMCRRAFVGFEPAGDLMIGRDTPIGTRADAILFASSSAVQSFVDQAAALTLQKDARRPLAGSIGPQTTETMKQAGMPVDFEARTPSLDALVDALVKKLGA